MSDSLIMCERSGILLPDSPTKPGGILPARRLSGYFNRLLVAGDEIDDARYLPGVNIMTENIIIGLIALGILVYLGYILIYPEKL